MMIKDNNNNTNTITITKAVYKHYKSIESIQCRTVLNI